MNPVSLITGVTGQDGSYLAEALLVAGRRRVYGVARPTTGGGYGSLPSWVVNHHRYFHIHADMTDPAALRDAVERAQPDEIFNLAAQSHVAESFRCPGLTYQINAIGAVTLLNLCEQIVPWGRFYQASTSELYGDSPPPQNEDTPMRPRSPYAASKLAAYWAVRNARERGYFAVNGILFNHESPRRGPDFVTQKIARGIWSAMNGGQPLRLGNLDARRDWGHARDYVEAMIRMVEADQPNDYVIATGETWSVRDFLSAAIDVVEPGAAPEWDETGGSVNGRRIVIVDPKFFRPLEVEHLHGDPSRSHHLLGWRPATPFAELVREMVESTRPTNEQGSIKAYV